MKTSVRIPKFLHVLLGTHQQRTELILIVIFTLTATLVVSWATAPYWLELKWYQILVLWLLFIDMSGGVVANLSTGTNNYYNAYPKKGRWLFIAVHAQPLILATILQSQLSIAVAVWLYTILSASLINSLREKVYHRLLAGTLYVTAIIGYVLSDISLPLPITLIYLLYMMKLIYSFAVDHTGDA